MTNLRKFDDLPLGARFRYPKGMEVWVKLQGNECGLVVRYVPIDSGISQSVCSAVESEQLRQRLMVEPTHELAPAPSIASRTSATSAGPLHPDDYRPIFREVMNESVRLGHLVTNGYNDHYWTFRPDQCFANRRPTSAKSADPVDALPNWVRRQPYKILSAEETAEIYERMNEDSAGFSAGSPGRG